jgi:hypothetical protein
MVSAFGSPGILLALVSVCAGADSTERSTAVVLEQHREAVRTGAILRRAIRRDRIPALAQEAQPKLTPEQQAEMEAYTKAGTPGAEHKALAATAGSYDIKVRSWMEPDR